MNEKKPTIVENIVFFIILTLFIVSAITLVQSGIIKVFTILGKCS